jgi:hypothetical protein
MPPVKSTSASHTPASRGGEDRWFSVAQGQMKGRVYSTETLSLHPILVVVLHGDVPTPPPGYHYDFAQALTEGFDSIKDLPASVRPVFGASPKIGNLVAVGLTRPGYLDRDGDRSDGEGAWTR